ncbi:MAG TPA: sigma-70 family RNA polymerase sigma factor, partial [Oxalicibacterium sp.]|nr:sigma-70 family RNA polymerase sigma factor [Oxalicibacterium sp.]
MSLTPSLLQQEMHVLYSDHHGWLHGWLRKKLGCSFQAEDLAQDAFLRLIVRPRQFDAAYDPRAYLTKIAQGLVIDLWRRQEIERTWLATLAANPESVVPSAEQQAIIIETLMEVDRTLAQLPEKPRRALLLAHLHDMTYAEIAGMLEVSERMVKKYMAQAMLHCLVSGA